MSHVRSLLLTAILWAGVLFQLCLAKPPQDLNGKLYSEWVFYLAGGNRHEQRLIEFGPNNTWREILVTAYEGDFYPDVTIRRPSSGTYTYEVTDSSQAILSLTATIQGDPHVLRFDEPSAGRLSFSRDRLGGPIFRIGSFKFHSTAAIHPLLNTSTRGRVDSSHPLLGGFVIRSESLVLVRAVGPGLRAFRVSDAAQDPKLNVIGPRDLAKATGTPNNDAFNDNWGDALGDVTRMAQLVGAFPLPPGSLDAALVLRLAKGTYVSKASVADGDAGDVLLEVYILDDAT